MGTARPPSGAFRAAWHLGALGVLALVPPQVMLGEPLWALEPSRVPHVLAFPAAYALAALVGVAAAGRTRVRLAAGAAALASLYLGLLLSRAPYARSVLLAASVGTLALIAAPALLGRYRRAGVVSLHVVLAAVLAWGAARPLAPSDEAGPAVSRTVIHTSRHSVVAVRHRGVVDPPRASGGGIATTGEAHLVATGDGDLLHLSREARADSLRIVPLEASVPLNADEFVADVGPRVHTPWFRVTDVLVRGRGEDARIFAAHHHWRSGEACFVLRLSVAAIRPDRLPAAGGPSSWRTVFETEPCLPLKEAGPGHRFAGLQAGGSLAELDADRLLLTVGDHEFDGWKSERALPRDTAADYGKTLVIADDGSVETFSVGHRNPQGLHVGPGATVWATEHGPEGGDELNRLVPGGDYGWPLETHGTAYGDVEWPLAAESARGPASRGGHRAPVFAWVPSIGVSELVTVRGAAFSRWTGDLLVGSLVGRSLFRLRVSDGAVRYAEPIPLDARIRDLAEGPDGRIVLWTDAASVIVLERAASNERGAVAFRRCVACHAAGEGQAPATGPDLDGVVGREIASREEFGYSDALASLDGRWTRPRLDSFLADPQGFAPGTRMQIEGVADEETRAALIDYLEQTD